jgi:hypothetical protein
MGRVQQLPYQLVQQELWLCLLAECACRPICAEGAATTAWRGCSSSLCVPAVLCGAGEGAGQGGGTTRHAP